MLHICWEPTQLGQTEAATGACGHGIRLQPGVRSGRPPTDPPGVTSRRNPSCPLRELSEGDLRAGHWERRTATAELVSSLGAQKQSSGRGILPRATPEVLPGSSRTSRACNARARPPAGERPQQ